MQHSYGAANALDRHILSDIHAGFGLISHLLADRLMPDLGHTWSSIVSEYADTMNYLSLSIATRPGEVIPAALIEFGVCDGQDRHATGILVARWDREQSKVQGTEAVLLDGQPVDVGMFAAKLEGFLGLPSTLSEASDHDAR